MGKPTHTHHEEKKKDTSHAPHPAKTGDGGVSRLASIAGAPLEYWWRNAVKGIFANSRLLRQAISFDRTSDAHYLCLGPKQLGIKVPVQLGLLGLQLSSGAVKFSNPLLTRLVGEALEEIAFEATDAYHKGQLDSHDEVEKVAKSAATKIEERINMCQVILENDVVVAHHADCIMMAARNDKNPIKRTLKQVIAQGVPLATGCGFCGKILQGLQKEEAMGEHGHDGHSGGGHAPQGAKTAKEVKMSGAEALGKFGEKYPEKVRVVYDFVKWWGTEYPNEAQHFLAEADKEDEYHALANAPDHETRRNIALSMLEARGMGGSFVTGFKHMLGIGQKAKGEAAQSAYAEAAKKRLGAKRRTSITMKLLGLGEE